MESFQRRALRLLSLVVVLLPGWARADALEGFGLLFVLVPVAGTLIGLVMLTSLVHGIWLLVRPDPARARWGIVLGSLQLALAVAAGFYWPGPWLMVPAILSMLGFGSAWSVRPPAPPAPRFARIWLAVTYLLLLGIPTGLLLPLSPWLFAMVVGSFKVHLILLGLLIVAAVVLAWWLGIHLLAPLDWPRWKTSLLAVALAAPGGAGVYLLDKHFALGRDDAAIFVVVVGVLLTSSAVGLALVSLLWRERTGWPGRVVGAALCAFGLTLLVGVPDLPAAFAVLALALGVATFVLAGSRPPLPPAPARVTPRWGYGSYLVAFTVHVFVWSNLLIWQMTELDMVRTGSLPLALILGGLLAAANCGAGLVLTRALGISPIFALSLSGGGSALSIAGVLALFAFAS